MIIRNPYFDRTRLFAKESAYWAKESRDIYPNANIFFWSIFLTFLLASCIGTWVACLFVFNYPEKAICYKILHKFNKLPKPALFSRYSSPKIPSGDYLDDNELYNTFYQKDAKKRKILNSLLKRNFIENYRKPHVKPVFAKGEYRIIQIRKLKPTDVFTQGLILRAQALKRRELYIEIILPGENINQQSFEINDKINLLGRVDNYTVLHVEPLREYSICLSLISLNYHSLLARDENKLKLTPPSALNLDGSWPITDDIIGRPDSE